MPVVWDASLASDQSQAERLTIRGSTMAKTPPPVPLPKPSTGFPVVIGPRDVFAKYAVRPWVEVIAAAERGDDGLRVDVFESPTWYPKNGEFAVREMLTGPASALLGATALLSQRWVTRLLWRLGSWSVALLLLGGVLILMTIVLVVLWLFATPAAHDAMRASMRKLT
jgi:hypothetical protein